MADSPSRLTTWCRLLRLPNLFTVPGDPLAGFMLATGGMLDWRVAGAIAVSLLLYSAGLLLNDYFDRDIDAKERPERPIPSGAVRAGTVLAVGLVLLAGGIAIGFAIGGPIAGLVASAVALAVLAYDGWLKHVKGVGQVVMGSCRAGSVLVGAAFAGTVAAPAALTAAGVMGIYIAAVTVLAAREMGPARPGIGAFVPSALLVAGWLAMEPFFSRSGGPTVFGFAFMTIAVLDVSAAASSVRRGRIPVPPFIGRLIRAMITVQAAWCLWPTTPETWGAGVMAVSALVVLRIGAEATSRHFYGS